MTNHGYERLARAALLSGASARFISRICDEAHMEGVPVDVVYRIGRTWVRDYEITDGRQRLALGLSPLSEGRPSEGMARVRIRFTEVCTAIVEVPRDAVRQPQRVFNLMNGQLWTGNVAIEVVDTFVNEVVRL